MKLLQHINYFFYIASNWGVRIGLFTLNQEWRGEKKYGINTTSANELTEFKIKGNQLAHATEYMPVNYFTIEQVLDHLPEKAKQGMFLDIGCGKGRALCVAAAYGFIKLYGIDFAKQLIDQAEQNLLLAKKRYPNLNYELSWSDISTLEIGKEVSTVFLFNPFDEVLMKKIIQKINSSLQQNPRELYVLYCSPRHEELFFADGYNVLFRIKKYNFLEGTIFSKTNALS
ncbi:MAG: class I SAM-dependent methyltransferase [Lacibacter sp.]|nr:class I SAM-dependent methyltransferase [Lacibacter sp.]